MKYITTDRQLQSKAGLEEHITIIQIAIGMSLPQPKLKMGLQFLEQEPVNKDWDNIGFG